MGCNNCGGDNSRGCGHSGSCKGGRCSRLNVYDWLADIPVASEEDRCPLVEVSFNHGSRKDFYRNNTVRNLFTGDMVAVEGVNGFDVGRVSLSGELVRLQMKKKGISEENGEFKRILRLASSFDLAKWKETKAWEKEVLIRSRSLARSLNLEMKISEVEIQADARKATFFYIADGRVDFRELIKLYASEFKLKVEMKQIGARQEAGKIGGIGTSGRELCSSTWLTCFKSVSTNAARYQNLSINQTKLSGQCGRLKCCLNFELDTYLDALKNFPEGADTIEMARGKAYLVKKDIFRNLMWYSTSESTKYYPLSIDTVKELLEQNKKGIKPEALQTVEIRSERAKEIEPEFVDVVGQISLKSLEKSGKRQRKKNQKVMTKDNVQRPFNPKGTNNPSKLSGRNKKKKNGGDTSRLNNGNRQGMN